MAKVKTFRKRNRKNKTFRKRNRNRSKNKLYGGRSRKRRVNKQFSKRVKMNYLSKKRRKRSKKMYGGKSYNDLTPEEKGEADELVAENVRISFKMLDEHHKARMSNNWKNFMKMNTDKEKNRKKLENMGLDATELYTLDVAARKRLRKQLDEEEEAKKKAIQLDKIRLEQQIVYDKNKKRRVEAAAASRQGAAEGEAAETRARNREATKRTKAKIREATQAAKAEAQRREPGSEWDASPKLITRWQPDLHISTQGGAAGQ